MYKNSFIYTQLYHGDNVRGAWKSLYSQRKKKFKNKLTALSSMCQNSDGKLSVAASDKG